jgi:hypothetical protein
MSAFTLWNFVRESNNQYKRQAREASIGEAEDELRNSNSEITSDCEEIAIGRVEHPRVGD